MRRGRVKNDSQISSLGIRMEGNISLKMVHRRGAEGLQGGGANASGK